VVVVVEVEVVVAVEVPVETVTFPSWLVIATDLALESAATACWRVIL